MDREDYSQTHVLITRRDLFTHQIPVEFLNCRAKMLEVMQKILLLMTDIKIGKLIKPVMNFGKWMKK